MQSRSVRTRCEETSQPRPLTRKKSVFGFIVPGRLESPMVRKCGSKQASR
ncbi:hypothetical protein LEMLEM_LOCUS8869, partial [Lemmus lemmus]